MVSILKAKIPNVATSTFRFEEPPNGCLMGDVPTKIHFNRFNFAVGYFENFSVAKRFPGI
jgi:hypothetical protein